MLGEITKVGFMNIKPRQNKRKLVGGWFLPEEKAEVNALARQAQITTSEFMCRVALGRELPNANLREATIELVKINADLARLGNLFRMAVMEEDFNFPDGQTLEDVIEEIRQTQSELKTKIKGLK